MDQAQSNVNLRQPAAAEVAVPVPPAARSATGTEVAFPEPPAAGSAAGSGDGIEYRWTRLVPLVLLVAAIFAVAYLGWRDNVGDAARHIRNIAGESLYRSLVTELILNPWFYAIFALVLVLERLIPAKENQTSVTTRGSLQDALWLLLRIPIFALVMPFYAVVLNHFYDRYLSFLTIDAVAAWPWAAKVVFALLFGDLMFWVSHFLRHKILYLWHFHAVHHSQKELNFLTEYRTHPFDNAFIYLINFIPLFMVESGTATVVAIIWIRHWHTRLYHANIRSNFGWLRYVLVTPQSHRVHHSIEPRHADTNFGLTFSIWDHLFGTQYRGYDEYPDTGIDDEMFPFEQEHAGPGTLWAQLLYPFRALAAVPKPARAESGD